MKEFLKESYDKPLALPSGERYTLGKKGNGPVQTAYVTSKGQLVVPASIRRRYGIKPGTRINFYEENGKIIFQPVTREYIRSFRGMFKLNPGEKRATRELREDREAERKREV